MKWFLLGRIRPRYVARSILHFYINGRGGSVRERRNAIERIPLFHGGSLWARDRLWRDDETRRHLSLHANLVENQILSRGR